ncbi:developmental and secondary metabolism regulator ve-1-like [Penaeus monodon]|uniref:developmental and secondary metabolism regulator ve-1-like n=1 Tax=Penaeus monodon TaxID=6687 RepID=UPI0018A6F76C|nr:developmental and secondary metabolism regulator ve-1-like [Penaeus monodon]
MHYRNLSIRESRTIGQFRQFPLPTTTTTTTYCQLPHHHRLTSTTTNRPTVPTCVCLCLYSASASASPSTSTYYLLVSASIVDLLPPSFDNHRPRSPLASASGLCSGLILHLPPSPLRSTSVVTRLPPSLSHNHRQRCPYSTNLHPPPPSSTPLCHPSSFTSHTLDPAPTAPPSHLHVRTPLRRRPFSASRETASPLHPPPDHATSHPLHHHRRTLRALSPPPTDHAASASTSTSIDDSLADVIPQHHGKQAVLCNHRHRTTPNSPPPPSATPLPWHPTPRETAVAKPTHMTLFLYDTLGLQAIVVVTPGRRYKEAV